MFGIEKAPPGRPGDRHRGKEGSREKDHAPSRNLNTVPFAAVFWLKDQLWLKCAGRPGMAMWCRAYRPAWLTA
jgi:hypothetical protein